MSLLLLFASAGEQQAANETGSLLLPGAALVAPSGTYLIPGVGIVSHPAPPATATVSVTLSDATLSAGATVADAEAAAAPVYIARNAVAVTTEHCRSKARIAAAFLLLTLSAPNGGSLTGTLDGVSLSAAAGTTIEATTSATLADATVSAGGSVGSVQEGAFAATIEAATLSAGATAPIDATAAVTTANATLSAGGSAPIGATLSVTASAATLAATGSAPVAATESVTLAAATLAATAAVEDAAPVQPILGRPRRPIVLEEAIEVGRRYHAIQGDHVTAPARQADAATTLDAATLAATGESIAEAYDLYLGGDTRREAFAAPHVQRPRSKYPHLLTSLATIQAQLDLSGTVEDVTLAATGVGPSGADVSVSFDGVALGSAAAVQDAPAATFAATLDAATLGARVGVDGALSVTLDDTALAADASPIPTITATVAPVTLDAVTGSGQAATTAEAAFERWLDAFTLTAQDVPPLGIGHATPILDAVRLTGRAETQSELGSNLDGRLADVTSSATAEASSTRVGYIHVTVQAAGRIRAELRAPRIVATLQKDRIT